MANTFNPFESFVQLENSNAPEGLEELFAMDLAEGIAEAKRISANTSDKAYRKLTSHANVTSYSLLTDLHACPRRFELEKYSANTVALEIEGDINLDFAYGHAVGAGVQTYAATRNLVASQFAAFCAWKAPWDAEKFNKRGVSAKKSLTHAMIAVEKFQRVWDMAFQEWNVYVFPTGKPAVELAFAVNFENGFWYFGHIDMVLVHKIHKQLAVYEGKTTGWSVNPASWGNSNQAIGYGVVVDKIAKDLGWETDYDVLYNIYSTGEEEFTVIPFHKSRTMRAGWLQDILLDHQTIATYQKLKFFPKRGESCVNQWGRECYWYGQCQMANDALFPGVVPPNLEDVHGVEALDYVFNLSELLAAQKEKK